MTAVDRLTRKVMLNMTYVNFISLIQLSICEILYAVMCISKHAKLFESMLLFYDFHAEIQGTGSRSELTVNKCIGDDTKAATRQSPNCIKKNQKKYGEKRFSIWQLEFLHL